jgi:dienelactone hydrolase
MKIPVVHQLSGTLQPLQRQVLSTALGVNGISDELPFDTSDPQRPVLHFVRGTGASTHALDLYHQVLFHEVELLTGVEVNDIRLVHNGLRCRQNNLEEALREIEAHHRREPERRVVTAGWSQGANVAIEAPICFPWVLGVIAFAPCLQGSRLSHPRIPGALGEYGPDHPTTRASRERVAQWIGSATAVPVLLFWSGLDLLNWPARAACIEGARNVQLKWMWNHFNAPFAPEAMAGSYRFLAELLATPQNQPVPKLTTACGSRRRPRRTTAVAAARTSRRQAA